MAYLPNMVRQQCSAILFSLAILVCSLSPAYAAEDFFTTFSTTYDVSTDGTSTVTQNIKLTNKLSNVYATKYALEIGSTRLRKVVAFDRGNNPISHSLTTTDNKSIIVVNFDDKIVGKGQTQDFTIKYENPDASQKNGQILEINIPKLTSESQIDSYDVTLNVPLVFGHPKIVTPGSGKTTQEGKRSILHFDSPDIMTQGITAIFGQMQVFDLHLTYNLENPTVSNAETQIALPPDTSYQKMYYHSFSKNPVSIELDPDQNWIATYKLEPKEKLTLTVTASAIIYMDPLISIPAVDQNKLSQFTKAQKFWETDDADIQNLAAKYKTPESIYRYLVDDFTYNYDRISSGIGRLGAINAVKHPDNAICTEFTDVFITLARANTIPAREINGFAYTQNAIIKPLSLLQDVLHSWPEYFDVRENRWIPVDPTWGNTTGGVDYFHHLDFNHIVFAIHGINSERPYPAGYYKFQNTDSKDVNITFSESIPEAVMDFSLDFQASKLNLFSADQTVTATIKNLSNHALYNVPVGISVFPGDLLSSTAKTLPVMLPFSSQNIHIKLKPAGSQSKITLRLNEENEYTYDLQSHVVGSQIALYGGLSALGCLCLVLVYKLRRLLVQKRG